LFGNTIDDPQPLWKATMASTLERTMFTIEQINKYYRSNFYVVGSSASSVFIADLNRSWPSFSQNEKRTASLRRLDINYK